MQIRLHVGILLLCFSALFLWQGRHSATTSIRGMATQQSTYIDGDTGGAMVVYVTVPSQDVADALASGLVEAKLAACVNIVPGLTSVYYWEGKVNKDSELLLMIKTQQGKMPQLTSWVKEKHPYDECEVIGVPITGGSRSYIQWVLDSTAG